MNVVLSNFNEIRNGVAADVKSEMQLGCLRVDRTIKSIDVIIGARVKCDGLIVRYFDVVLLRDRHHGRSARSDTQSSTPTHIDMTRAASIQNLILFLDVASVELVQHTAGIRRN